MNRRRGFILVLAILFLALLELLAISVALRVPQGVREAARLGDETVAYLVAEAGVQDTVAWLEYQLQNGIEPELKPRSGQLGEDRWTVSLEPDEYTAPKGSHSCRCYKLIATGTRGTLTRQIKASIVQESFGRYARFINHWANTADADHTVYFWGGPIYVNGPVHSNEWLWVEAYPDFYDGSYDYKHPPRLFDTNWVSCVEGVVKGDHYPVTDDQFLKIYSTTRRSRAPRKLRKRIEPPKLVELEGRAAGGGSFPTASGVHIVASGGVCVVGEVKELELDHLKQKFVMGSDVYLVEEIPGGAKLSVNGSPQTTLPDPLNGLIYVKGSVASFKGVNSGEHTLMTEVSSDTDREVQLTGNVTCTTGSHLGVITDHLHLPGPGRLARNLVPDGENDVQFQAALYMVGKHGEGGFIVDEMVSEPRRLGRLIVQGCIIEGRRRRCASASETSGWDVVVDHSKLNTHNPAPFFPALPKFDVTAIEAEQR